MARELPVLDGLGMWRAGLMWQQSVALAGKLGRCTKAPRFPGLRGPVQLAGAAPLLLVVLNRSEAGKYRVLLGTTGCGSHCLLRSRPRQLDMAGMVNTGIFPVSSRGQRSGSRAPHPPGCDLIPR
jgi:hypothetical protein